MKHRDHDILPLALAMVKQPGDAACFASLGCTQARWTPSSSWTTRCYPDRAPRTRHGDTPRPEHAGCLGPAGHQSGAQPGAVARDARTARSGKTGGLPKAAKPDLRHGQKYPRAQWRQGRLQLEPARGGGLQAAKPRTRRRMPQRAPVPW